MNLDEVAKRAGASTATVSRVLNQTSAVRNATRQRVTRAISELNYHPNLHARSLAKGASRTLGMIASNLQNPFFFDICRALETDAYTHGYDVLVADTDYNSEHLVRCVRLMIGRRVAGLAVIVSEMDPGLISELAASKLRVVFYDVGTAGRTMSNIRVNYRRGIELVVEYLHNLNHRRLAFVGHHAALGPLSEREKAFVETVSRYAPRTEWRTVATQDAREILSSGFQPTAIICVNDVMAVGVLREVREQGLRVPENISVTGFDNIKLSEFSYPPLTTVHIPRDRIGHLAFSMLVPESASGKLPGREIVIDPELVLRDSTGPAPRTKGPS